MLHCPVGNPYPGKYVCFAMAALCVTLAWRSTNTALWTMSGQRKTAAQGILFKPDVNKSAGANVVAAFVATFLLATLLAAIYLAWPN